MNKVFDAKRFELISPLLFQLKSAFVGSRLDLTFITDTEFELFRAKILPIFNRCKHFNFRCVRCHPFDKGSAFLASLLQHPSIRKASSIDIVFRSLFYNSPRAKLPIASISHWLHRPCAAIPAAKLTSKPMEKRCLNVFFDSIENISKMIKHLKKVFIFTLPL